MSDSAAHDRMDRRPDKRYKLALRATMSGTPMDMSNLSVTGAQLVCPADKVTTLPPDLMIDMHDIEFELPDKSVLKMRCAVVYVRKHQDLRLIGLRFIHFHNDSYNLLYRFIQSQTAA